MEIGSLEPKGRVIYKKIGKWGFEKQPTLNLWVMILFYVWFSVFMCFFLIIILSMIIKNLSQILNSDYFLLH